MTQRKEKRVLKDFKMRKYHLDLYYLIHSLLGPHCSRLWKDCALTRTDCATGVALPNPELTDLCVGQRNHVQI